MDRLDFLKQEISEGPERTPPMPDIQVAIHIKEMNLLESEFSLPKPVVDLAYIQRLGHLPGCHLYDTDGESLAG